MSEKKNENGSVSSADGQPEKAQAPETAAKAPVTPIKAEAEAAPVEPGEFGQRLQKAKQKFKPLGADAQGVEMIEVAVGDVLSVARFLRDECGFDLLLSCTGIDWKDRLESVYHAYATTTHQYIALKVTAENEHSPSLTAIWPAADWHERESYDLVGIQYDGHPNLTRILMPNDWLGHPLRKDYKVDDPRLVWNER